MANTSSSSAVMSLKLLINTQTQRVIFAEAGKDFVDFLFCILSLPVAKVLGIVGKQSMAGSLWNLYESVENLNETYLQPNQTKSSLLKSTASYGVPLLAVEGAPAAPQKRTFYRCYVYNCHKTVSSDPFATCAHCDGSLTYEMSYVATPEEKKLVSGEGGGGFVKGVVTY